MGYQPRSTKPPAPAWRTLLELLTRRRRASPQPDTGSSLPGWRDLRISAEPIVLAGSWGAIFRDVADSACCRPPATGKPGGGRQILA